MEKVLLDTDIGGDIDDAICRAGGRRIPIVAGLDTTLQPIGMYPTPEGADALQDWPHSIYEKGDAPAFLYKKIKENPHEVVLMGIGNMTNIATLFINYPDAAGLLKGLHVMNGYFGENPLPQPWFNWNSWADPLACEIVFSADISIHRAVPLEVTDLLTMDAGQAEILLGTDSDLMKAVLSFGNSWLKSSDKLTLHDPLAAVCAFHPEICQFERGNVRVETQWESHMGATTFTPCKNGSVEIARTVNREQFYHILSSTLRGACAEGEKGEKYV